MSTHLIFLLAEDEPTTKQLLVIGVCAVALIACIVLQLSRGRRVKELVKRWGDQNSIAFSELKNTGLRRGPFKFTANSKNIVMHATAVDEDGKSLTGWIRCRWSLTKLGEYTLTVKWDGFDQEIEHTDIDSDDPLERAGIR